MAKRRGRKSKAIRQILANHPAATVKDIQAALATKRVRASVALISKLKAGTRRGRKAHANGEALNLAHLLLAKQFVKKAGGVEPAKEALQQFARLIDA